MVTLNQQIADQFSEMANIISQTKTNSTDGFRAAAYDKAAAKLKQCSIDLSTLSVKDIQQTLGVGKASAEKIDEALSATDKMIPKLKQMRESFKIIADENSIYGPSDFSSEQHHVPVRRILSILNPTKSVIEVQGLSPDKKVYIVELGKADQNRITKMIGGVSMPVIGQDRERKNSIRRRSYKMEFYVYFF